MDAEQIQQLADLPRQLGVTLSLVVVLAFALLIIYKMVLRWTAPGTPGTQTRCQLGPKHYTQIEEIHAMATDDHESIEKMDEGILRGDFSCPWKGRDEVRDHFDLIRGNTEALRALTYEVKLLRQNGGPK